MVKLIIRSPYYRIGFARVEWFNSEKAARTRMMELNDHCQIEGA